MTIRCGIALLTLVGLAGAALGVDDPIAGRSLSMRQGKATARLVLVVHAPVVAPLPGGDEDPTLRGASLEIGNPRTGEWARLVAPASGWSINPLGTVFRFRAVSRAGTPGIRSLVIRHARRLKAKASAVGITLDEPTQGALAASLTTGTRRYCMLFGGEVRRDEPGRFAARDAPAPPACVGPPEGSATTSTTIVITTSTVRTPGAPSTTSTTRTSGSSSTSSTAPLGASTTTRPPSTITSSTSSSTSSTSASSSSTSTSSTTTTTTTKPGKGPKPKD